jgi:omega-amidase
MANDLRVALIQSDLKWENVEANIQQFEEKINSIQHEVDLVVLPEMFTTGFSMQARSLCSKSHYETVLTHLNKWARLTNAIVCGSVMCKDDKKYYNRLIWMQPDDSYSTYDKRHLFGLGDENKYYTAGKKPIICTYKDWDIKPLVCYDLRFPVWCRNKNDYDILLFVANWPEKRIHAWKQLLIARAIENQAYVIAVNRVGNDGNGIYHNGCSMIIDPKGEIKEEVLHHEKIIYATLSKGFLNEVRKDFPFLKDADSFKLK